MTTQLPPQGPSEPDEQLPGEPGLAALYRQLPRNEPAPALDAAVLNAAAQALASGEEERSRRPRWLIALGSAATLVLAGGLAWHMRAWPPTESAPTSADSAAPAQAAAPAPRMAPAGAPMSPVEPAAATLSMPAMQPPRPKMVAAKSPAPGALRMRGRMPVAPTPIEPFTGTDTASNAGDTPAQELNKIRHLFALGRDDEARQRLTAFHLAHPRWDLPLDLQPRLSKP